MIKQISLSSTSIRLSGRGKLVSMIDEEYNDKEYITVIDKQIVTLLYSNDNIDFSTTSVKKLWHILEEYLMKKYYKINWSMIDRRKLIDEVMISLLVGCSSVQEDEIVSNNMSKNEIIFYNIDDYDNFMNNLIDQVNESIPMMCKMGVYNLKK